MSDNALHGGRPAVSLQPERIASATLHIGDCLDVLPQLAAEGFRALRLALNSRIRAAVAWAAQRNQVVDVVGRHVVGEQSERPNVMRVRSSAVSSCHDGSVA